MFAWRNRKKDIAAAPPAGFKASASSESLEKDGCGEHSYRIGLCTVETRAFERWTDEHNEICQHRDFVVEMIHKPFCWVVEVRCTAPGCPMETRDISHLDHI